VPITEDAYLWAVKTESMKDPEVASFIEMLRTKEFQLEVNSLPGYECDESGYTTVLEELR